jgi:hypothetical protein
MSLARDFPPLQKPYRKPELAARLRAALEPQPVVP